MSMAFGSHLKLLLLLIVVMSVTVPSTGAAAEGEEAEWAEEGRNSLGLFLGAAMRDDDVNFSLGVDYELRLSRLFGIGAVGEWTAGDLREGILAAGVAWHAWRTLKVIAVAGVEVTPSEREDEFLARVGADYGFPVGERGYEIKPAVYVDFAGEEVTYVLGALVCRSF